MPSSAHSTSLTPEEMERYKPFMAVPGWREPGQLKLKNTTAFVAGAGRSSLPLVTQLAALGVGTIRVGGLDPREPVEGVLEAAAAANPLVKCEMVEHPIYMERLDEYRADSAEIAAVVGEGVDLLFDITDMIPSKFALNRLSIERNLPFFYGALQVFGGSSILLQPPRTPCFECLFDGSIFREVMEKVGAASTHPTIPLIPPSRHFVASLLAMEALKLHLNIGAPAWNIMMFGLLQGVPKLRQTITYHGFTGWFTPHMRTLCEEAGLDLRNPWTGRFVLEIPLRRDPACTACGHLESAHAAEDTPPAAAEEAPDFVHPHAI